MVELMRDAKGRGAEMVVFPELALTTFFPRYWMDEAEAEARFFEPAMPNAQVQPLFDEAKALGVGFYLGYAERTPEGTRYNTAIIVDRAGAIVGKYRKIHLPGHSEHKPEAPFQHLEKKFFEVGDLGFRVFDTMGTRFGMCLCNDRRWPETYRVMALQSAEVVVLGSTRPRSTSTGTSRCTCAPPRTWCRCRPMPTRTASGWRRPPSAARRTATT